MQPKTTKILIPAAIAYKTEAIILVKIFLLALQSTLVLIKLEASTIPAESTYMKVTKTAFCHVANSMLLPYIIIAIPIKNIDEAMVTGTLVCSNLSNA